jgi:hypothetical protein
MIEGLKKGDEIIVINEWHDGRHSSLNGTKQKFAYYINYNLGGKYYKYALQCGFSVYDVKPVEEEFKIPEKWCVRRQPKNDPVARYFNKRFGLGFSTDDCPNTYIGCDWRNNTYEWFYNTDSHFKQYIEITFEQFKKYILKQETMKPIIGYKLKDEQYREAINMLIKAYGIFSKPVMGLNSPKSIDTLQKAGVLDLWFTPVYEEEKVEIAGYKSEIIGNVVKFGCQEFEKPEIEAIYRLFDKEINASLSIGSHNITKEMVEKLLKMF